MKKPLLSILMITYNHESYIEQAIKGVFSQKVNFPVEFVISNDCSTDKTHQKIEEILKDSPENFTIKYYNHTENLGMMENFIFSLKQCHGKYIALCEGDDYWIDNNKLQKQVNFLEKNSDFTICHHRVKLNINGTEELHKYHVSKNTPIKQTLEDITKYNFIYTCSVVFRNIPVNKPDWYKFLPIGDYTLWLFLAKNGNIYYMPDIMGVYRIGSGVFSTETNISKLQTTNVALHFYKKIFPYCSIYYKNLDFQEKQNIRTISKYYLYNTVHKEKNIKDYISYKTIYKLILLKLNFLK